MVTPDFVNYLNSTDLTMDQKDKLQRMYVSVLTSFKTIYPNINITTILPHDYVLFHLCTLAKMNVNCIDMVLTNVQRQECWWKICNDLHWDTPVESQSHNYCCYVMEYLYACFGLDI